MNLNDLSQSQWAAALKAARVLREANPNDASDRARFRSARALLVDLLPTGADASDIICQAVRWYSMNDIAAALMMIPHSTPGETGTAQQAPVANHGL